MKWIFLIFPVVGALGLYLLLRPTKASRNPVSDGRELMIYRIRPSRAVTASERTFKKKEEDTRDVR